MARGITRDDVRKAADALLHDGERPTVEKVRLRLGTGSPNTIAPHLDAWWTDLSGRVIANERRMKLPDAPKSVAMLAQQLWDEAIEVAAKQANDALVLERHALDEDRNALSSERAAMKETLAAAETRAERAAEAEAAARLRIADLQENIRLLGDQLQAERDARTIEQARAASLEADKRGLQQQLDDYRDRLATQADAAAQHIRGVEEHAAKEIDRARQETKEIRAERAEAQSELKASRTELARLADELRQVSGRLDAANAQKTAADALAAAEADRRVAAEGLLRDAQELIARLGSKQVAPNSAQVGERSKSSSGKPRVRATR